MKLWIIKIGDTETPDAAALLARFASLVVSGERTTPAN